MRCSYDLLLYFYTARHAVRDELITRCFILTCFQRRAYVTREGYQPDLILYHDKFHIEGRYYLEGTVAVLTDERVYSKLAMAKL